MGVRVTHARGEAELALPEPPPGRWEAIGPLRVEAVEPTGDPAAGRLALHAVPAWRTYDPRALTDWLAEAGPSREDDAWMQCTTVARLLPRTVVAVMAALERDGIFVPGVARDAYATLHEGGWCSLIWFDVHEGTRILAVLSPVLVPQACAVCSACSDR